jgi:hypothetical protein
VKSALRKLGRCSADRIAGRWPLRLRVIEFNQFQHRNQRTRLISPRSLFSRLPSSLLPPSPLPRPAAASRSWGASRAEVDDWDSESGQHGRRPPNSRGVARQTHGQRLPLNRALPGPLPGTKRGQPLSPETGKVVISRMGSIPDWPIMGSEGAGPARLEARHS